MKIYFIRHAQAEHNVNHNINYFDPPITSLGQQQCQNKKHLYKDVDVVLTSTSTRALQTTLTLFEEYKNKYATDLLLEYNTGVPCNCRHDLDIQKQRFATIDFDTYFVSPLNRESSWYDGECRAKQVIELLKKINKPVIAVVSHANFIRNIMVLLTGENYELENGDAYVVII